MSSLESLTPKARSHVIDACIFAAKGRGWSAASGLLRGTLLLSDEPLSLDNLVTETGYSKSTVSTNMAILENHGIVRRVITPGDKKYRYECVIDHDSMKTAMLSVIQKEVQTIFRALELTEKEILENGTKDEPLLSRIAEIRRFYMQTIRLMKLLSERKNMDIIEILEKDSGHGD